jgi:Ca2+/Na+ antiporter
MFLPKNSVDRNILSAIAILGFGALISGFALMIHSFIMLAPSNSCTGRIHHIISKVLAIMSWTALGLTSIPLSLLSKPYNVLLPIVLSVVLLTLGAYLYLRSKTNDKKTDDKDLSEYEEHRKEITRLSELSQLVMSLSSGGLIGLFFGIQKNASNHARHPVVFATVLLTFTSFIFSISVMFLSQKPLMHLRSSSRKFFLRIGVGLCTFLLVLLALAALLIAYTFLKVYTVIVVIPALLVYVVWQFIKSCTDNPENIQGNLEEEEIKTVYTMGNKVRMLLISNYL